MNSYERFTARLQGLPVDRIPNFDILMAKAARHIHVPLSQYYLDYRVLVEANLAAASDFHLDILQAISDPYREASDFGLEVDFPADNLPMNRTPLLGAPEDIRKLVAPDPCAGQRMSDRLEAIRLFREQAGGKIPIMGWVEGALAEACDLRSMYYVMIDLGRRPEWLTDLLEICVEVGIAFARAQIEAGADIIGLGDAVCSQISPKMYRRFALPYERRIFAAVHELGGIGRLHICGKTTHLLPDMLESGADIIDLDWMVDLKQSAQLFGDRAAICGNFDPVNVMLLGTPQTVRTAVTDCLQMGGSRLFSGAGCEIPEDTPDENLSAQYQALVELSMV